MQAQKTRDYELIMLMGPEATEEEVSSMIERVDALISSGGGSVSDHENWGLKPLAYPINKFREGNYVSTRFTSDPGAIQELTRSLTASEEVLRYLVTVV